MLNHSFFNMGLSENGVYPQWNSHLVGIMISKTIGFRGLAYFQTNPYGPVRQLQPWRQRAHATICGCFDPSQADDMDVFENMIFYAN